MFEPLCLGRRAARTDCTPLVGPRLPRSDGIDRGDHNSTTAWATLLRLKPHPINSKKNIRPGCNYADQHTCTTLKLFDCAKGELIDTDVEPTLMRQLASTRQSPKAPEAQAPTLPLPKAPKGQDWRRAEDEGKSVKRDFASIAETAGMGSHT